MVVRRFGIALEILNRGQWRRVLLCGGTILGNQPSMQKSLAEFTARMAAIHGGGASIPWGLDQACLCTMPWRLGPSD